MIETQTHSSEGQQLYRRAEELIESFINGNRRSVAIEITLSVAPAVLASWVYEGLNADDKVILIKLLMARYQLQM